MTNYCAPMFSAEWTDATGDKHATLHHDTKHAALTAARDFMAAHPIAELSPDGRISAIRFSDNYVSSDYAGSYPRHPHLTDSARAAVANHATQALWYAWGAIDATPGTSLTVDHGLLFSREREASAIAFYSEEHYTLPNILDEWTAYVARHAATVAV